VLGLALGSLGLLMLQHLTGGHWGIVIRRPLESATRTLPLLAVLFLPIAFGMKYLYGAWLDPERVREEPLSAMQQGYLTAHGFYMRAIIYFAIWGLLVFIFNRWSREQDVNQGDRLLRRKLKMLAGPGIILYVFVMTFAAIDWVMSISPHWASTIYGFLFVAGQLISAVSLMIAVTVLLAKTAPMAGLIQERHISDLGKFLLTFVMLFAYFDFSQLLIIWSGNQPEEITFYRSRLYGGWGAVAVAVLVFHFFVPFFLLLSRDLKRNMRLLPKVAIYMIVIRLVDLYWMTRPEFTAHAIPSWIDVVVPIGLIGVWVGVFAYNLQKMPLLPLGDPKLSEAIAHHEH
jgi:Ni/Fe-hydrogenase subunit HybB-like protein